MCLVKLDLTNFLFFTSQIWSSGCKRGNLCLKFESESVCQLLCEIIAIIIQYMISRCACDFIRLELHLMYTNRSFELIQFLKIPIELNYIYFIFL